MIFEKAQADPKIQTKVSDGQDLVGLKEHPGWDVLKRYIENGSETFMRSLSARLLSGEPVGGAMQREIDYMRGAHDIARGILRYPDVAVANLEALAQRLYAAHLEEEAAKALESSSPYIDDATEEVA